MSGNLQNGYPVALGNKLVSAINHYGPSSYTQVTTGATPSGGDVVQASEFGLKWIEALLEVSGSDDGTYDIVPICGNNPTTGVTPVPVTSIILRWFTAAGRSEVAATTNLSGRSLSIVAIGT